VTFVVKEDVASDLRLLSTIGIVLEADSVTKAVQQFFETLNKSSRYAIAYGLTSAKKPETRQERFAKFMDMLVREEQPGPGSKKRKKA
jgi:hypothetical protein